MRRLIANVEFKTQKRNRKSNVTKNGYSVVENSVNQKKNRHA